MNDIWLLWHYRSLLAHIQSIYAMFSCENIWTSLRQHKIVRLFSVNISWTSFYTIGVYSFTFFFVLQNKPKLPINKRIFILFRFSFSAYSSRNVFLVECLIFSCLKELYGLREINKSNDWAYMKANHPHREINVLICSRLLKMSHWQVKKIFP